MAIEHEILRLISENPDMTMSELLHKSHHPRHEIDAAIRTSCLAVQTSKMLDSEEITPAQAIGLAKLPKEEQHIFIQLRNVDPVEFHRAINERCSVIRETEKARRALKFMQDYSIGPDGLKHRLDLTPEEEQELYKKFCEKYPLLKQLSPQISSCIYRFYGKNPDFDKGCWSVAVNSRSEKQARRMCATHLSAKGWPEIAKSVLNGECLVSNEPLGFECVILSDVEQAPKTSEG